MTAHGIEEIRPDASTFSAEIQSAIRTELERILSAPAFAQSNRCKRFLSFVVLETLSGRAGELKERTIGIRVFERANDYDTGGDSIVRVTSNEVRKRIGQFYKETETAHRIEIELPRGSYVPEFRIQPNRNGYSKAIDSLAGESASFANLSTDAAVSDIPLESGPASSHAEPSSRAATLEHAHSKVAELPTTNSSHRSKVKLVVLCFSLVLVLTAAFGIWRSQSQKKSPLVWDSFQLANSPVLICLGTHNLAAPNAPSNEATERFSDLVLHKEIIPVDDVTVIASTASLLGKKGIPFRVIGAGQVSLTDLRRQPVILIGGVDNRWTLRLTQDLRYRIERIDPGPKSEPIARISDSRSPGNAPWSVDFSVPMYKWKKDYAVVARFDDPTTGVPVLISAGLGNDGSVAASELLASDALPNQLKAEPSCSGKVNFESVIETEMIDAKPGPPHIIRLECW